VETIILRPDLRRALEQDAAQETKSVNDIVNDAIEHYLRERQRAKLNQEIAAYETMHPILRKNHLGHWVAIHNQQLVDADEDKLALYRRIRSKYEKTSVLIRQVSENPIEEVWIRTPTTGKNAL